MRTIQTTYRYRLEPNDAQATQMRQFAGARRWVWNWALSRRREHYQQTGKSLSVTKLCAELAALKQQPETAWLREMDSQALQQTLHDLDKAFQSFFVVSPRQNDGSYLGVVLHPNDAMFLGSLLYSDAQARRNNHFLSDRRDTVTVKNLMASADSIGLTESDGMFACRPASWLQLNHCSLDNTNNGQAHS